MAKVEGFHCVTEHNECAKSQKGNVWVVVCAAHLVARTADGSMFVSRGTGEAAKRVSDGSGTVPSWITCLPSVRLAISRTEFVPQTLTGGCRGLCCGLCWRYHAGSAAPCAAQQVTSVTSVKVARLRNPKELERAHGCNTLSEPHGVSEGGHKPEKNTS